jgi:hypothetical protein
MTPSVCVLCSETDVPVAAAVRLHFESFALPKI